MSENLQQKQIEHLADALRRLRGNPGSPILDIEWLLLRCEDTIGYQGELRQASIRQLIKDIKDFDERFPNLIPAELFPGHL